MTSLSTVYVILLFVSFLGCVGLAYLVLIVMDCRNDSSVPYLEVPAPVPPAVAVPDTIRWKHA